MNFILNPDEIKEALRQYVNRAEGYKVSSTAKVDIRVVDREGRPANLISATVEAEATDTTSEGEQNG